MSDAVIKKAVAFHKQGDTKQAEKNYLKALKKHPLDANLNYLLGILYGDMQQFRKAALRLRKAVQLKPGNKEYTIKYGYSLVDTNEYAQAVKVLSNALKMSPGDVEICNMLSLAFIGLRDYVAAVDTCQKALKIDPNYGLARFNLARSYQKWGKDEEARAAYLDLLEQDPDHGSALIALGRLHQESGEFKRSQDYFMRAIKVDPTNSIVNAEAFFHLSDLLERDQLAELERQLVNARDYHHNLGAEIYFDFSQGNLSLRQGQTDKAFQYLANGNAKRSKAIPYNKKQLEKQRDTIQALFNLEYVRSINSSAMGNKDRSLVFIIGMPRSGTTLIESILAAHASVVAGGELFIVDKLIRDEQLKLKQDYLYQSMNFKPEDYLDISNRYLESRGSYVDMGDAQFITDKYPHNFFHVGLIKLAFPEAKIIHCQRNAADTCLSIYMNYFSGALKYAFNMRDIAHFYSVYLSMMNYWDDLFSDIYHVAYEDVIDNQEAETRGLLEYIGLDWSDDCLNFYQKEQKIRTVSLQQVRKPIYSTSVSRWKKYQQYVQPLISSLDKYGVDYNVPDQ